MSGGSFNYFYSRAPEHLRNIASDLEGMADACQERAAGPPEKHWKTREAVDLAALAETGDFLRMLSMRAAGLARVLETFENITRSVEWWRSGDSSADDIIEAWKRLSRPSFPPREGTKS
jgi:hypothetical protein